MRIFITYFVLLGRGPNEGYLLNSLRKWLTKSAMTADWPHCILLLNCGCRSGSEGLNCHTVDKRLRWSLTSACHSLSCHHDLSSIRLWGNGNTCETVELTFILQVNLACGLNNKLYLEILDLIRVHCLLITEWCSFISIINISIIISIKEWGGTSDKPWARTKSLHWSTHSLTQTFVALVLL